MPSLIASQHRKISLDSANGPFPEEASPSSSYDSQIHDFGCDKKMFERETTLSTTSTMGASDSHSLDGGSTTAILPAAASSPQIQTKEIQLTKITLNLVPGTSSCDTSVAVNMTPTSDSAATASTSQKNMSKAAMLRQLFFAQSPTSSGNAAASNLPTTSHITMIDTTNNDMRLPTTDK